MPSFDELLRGLPSETQDLMKMIWDTMPPSEREELKNTLAKVPAAPAQLQELLRLTKQQFKTAFGKKQTVAIVGPANVGKSSLYNRLISSKRDEAKVSPIPGTTRINQEADTGLFSIIDTPGADAVGEVGESEKQHALSAAQTADFLVIVFDAIQGIKRTEQELFDELAALNKPYIVVLNKIDLVKREEKQVIERSALNLRLKPGQIVPTSAKEGKHIEQVVMAIAVAEPEIVAALGSALPEYRWRLALRNIISAASLSAGIALAPLPIIDMIPLLGVQSAMVLGIARIYNYNITIERARELLFTFGLGFLGRTLFQELSKLGGIPGWLLSSAIASSTTAVMGYAAVLWFGKGERLTTSSIKKISSDMTQTLIDSLRSLGKKKPSKRILQERITQALEKSPLSQNQIIIEDIEKQNPPPVNESPAATKQ
jgi:small GTP-binding protein